MQGVAHFNDAQQVMRAGAHAIGGVIGLACAYYLLSEGRSVRLLELIEASSRHTREALPGAMAEAEKEKVKE